MHRLTLVAAMLLVVPLPALAQFPARDAPDLVQGEVSIELVEEGVQYRDTDEDGRPAKIPEKRWRHTASISAPILAKPVTSDLKPLFDSAKKMTVEQRSQIILVTGSSWARAFREDENPYGETHIPVAPTAFHSTDVIWDMDPCNPTDANGRPNLVETYHSSVSATPKGRPLVFNMRLDASMADYRACATLVGLDRENAGSLSQENLEQNPDTSECTTHWVKSQAPTTGEGLNLPWGTSCTGATDADVVRKYDGTVEELHEPRIPVDVLNAWIAKPSGSRVFTLPFSEKETSSTRDRTVKGTLTVRLGDTSKKLEMSVVGSDDAYRKWLPVPEQDPASKPIRVHFSLSERGNPKKDKLVISLKEVSEYDGDCTNYPLPGHFKHEKDVYFPRSEWNLKNFDFDATDSALTTKEQVSEIDADVRVRDYAAYARVVAKAANGAEGQSKYDQRSFLTLPLDENDNLIADAWEKDVGIWDRGYGGKEDDDELPKGQKRNGDGLSVFEEYRGFMVISTLLGKADDSKGPLSGHVRTSPKHKDIFLLDETGKFEQLYAPVNPSELTWHLVDKTQMPIDPISYDMDDCIETPRNRLINFNSPAKAMLADQHGLHLVFASPEYRTGESDPTDMTTAAAAMGAEGVTKNVSNRCYVWIRKENQFATAVNGIVKSMITNGVIQNITDAQIATIARNQYEATIIHELGHALGIEHHCRGVRVLPGSKEQLTCSASHRTQQIHWHLAAGGVPSCAMKYSFSDPKEFDSGTIFNRQIKYCRKGEPYTDDLGHKQDADDCFGQIDVVGSPTHKFTPSGDSLSPPKNGAAPRAKH